MLIMSIKLYVSRNVFIRMVHVSGESDDSDDMFDHDVAAGATISAACSPCLAGTYFSGSGWTPLSKRRGARTTKRPWMSAYGCRESRSKDDKATLFCCRLVGALNLGQDGDEESRVQNVTVRGAAIPGPEPVYTPCGGCACRWPGNASAGGCKQSRWFTIEPARSGPA
jgi:hypothetical protein